MATIYGNTTNHWRAYMTYSTSETATAMTISVTAAGFQSVAWGFQLSSGVSTSVTCTGQSTMSGSGSFYSGTGATTAQSYVTATYTISKSTSAKTVTLGVTTTNSSGYMDGTSSASVSINVPALASYSVTYNANGGSGAPATQTKYYGQTLTLSATKPTRSGYLFLGWNTSSSATTALYQPGASYTSNAALALYAVWKLDYIQPTISNLKAVRCNSSGTASDSGTYIKVTGSWKVDTSITSSNKATNLKIEYKVSTASSWTSASSTNPAAVSGTISSVIGGGGIATSSIYDIRVTVTDSGGSSSATTQVYKAFATIDIANSGNSVGIGCVASESTAGLDVAMASRFSNGITANKLSLPYGALGGRNLLLKSALSVTNNDYRCVSYTPSVYLEAGKVYTITLCVTPASGVSYFCPYLSDGNAIQCFLYVSGTSKQIITETFTASYYSGMTPSDNASYGNVNLYRFPSDGTVTNNTTIHWCKIEEGYVPTGWTAAPEDCNPIVSSGTSGGWTYYKYLDGRAECQKQFTINSTSLTAYGAAYYQTVSSIFPFTFAAIPEIFMSSRTTGLGLWGQSMEANTSTSQVGFHVWSMGDTNGQTLYVQILAKGRWK